MSYTEDQRRKAKERSQAAIEARKHREETIIEWDAIIARLKQMLDQLDQKDRR